MTEIPPDPPTRAARRRFLRSHDDRVVGGVAAALADQLRVDALVVRLGFVALVVLGGFGVGLYALAWLVVPADDGTGHPAPRQLDWARGAIALGLIVLVFGGVALASSLGAGWVGGAIVVPLALLVIAGYVVALLRSVPGDDGRPIGLRLLSAAVLVAAVAVGTGVLMLASAWLTAAGGGVAVAVVVLGLGVALLAGAARPDVPRWLVVPALALALPSAAVAAAGVKLDGGVGEKEFRPVGRTPLADRYRLGVGELRVDLRDLDWSGSRHEVLHVSLGAGHVLVLVPEDVCVGARTRFGVGYGDVLGHDGGGVDVAPQLDRGPALGPGPRLVLDADIGAGALEVRHEEPYEEFRDGHRIGRDDQDDFGSTRAERRAGDAACRAEATR